jgi:hypothetical protein
MEPQHEQALKDILSKNSHEFVRWVGNLSEEEIDYVAWLLNKADAALDELLFEKFGLVEAQYVITQIMEK